MADIAQGLALIVASVLLIALGGSIASDYRGMTTHLVAWQQRRLERRPTWLRGNARDQTVGAWRGWGVLLAVMGVLMGSVVVMAIPVSWLSRAGLILFYVAAVTFVVAVLGWAASNKAAKQR